MNQKINEAGKLPQTLAPMWFIGVLKERNGEQEYTHKVLLQVCGDPDETLRNVAQAFYDDCGEPDGDGFYHNAGSVFVEPSGATLVEAKEAAVLEKVLSVYRDDAVIEWVPPSTAAGKPPEIQCSEDNGTNAKVTFSAQGSITQTVKMLDRRYTPERLLSGLNSAELLTTIQENGTVDVTASGTVVAKVVNVDNHLEYSEFELRS